MSEIGGIEGGGGIGGAGPSTHAEAPAPAGGVSDNEKRDVAAEVKSVPNAVASTVGDDIVQNDDHFVATAQKQEPNVVERVADWVGQTAKGYATGAINTVLDTASMINKPINMGLNAAGVDYQFPTGIRLEPTSPAEANAQNAIDVAALVTGAASAIKSAPALVKAADNAFDAARTALGIGTATKQVVLGDLRAHEIAAIQAAANLAKEEIYVTGSAAKGTRRLDPDLPLGNFGAPKAGTRSDIDYAVRPSADDAINKLNLPDVDPSFGVRGVDYINLQSGPAIRFSPFKPPEFLPQGGPKLWLNGMP